MSTDSRKGEKVGWIVGWLGGFLWLLILAIVWLVQGKTLLGLGGLVLFVAAVATILLTAPWKHPHTAFWKLMLPVYMLFFLGVGLATWVADAEAMGLSWWSLFLLLPILSPFVTVGKRKWSKA